MGELLILVCGFGAGLLVGWNALPQPERARKLWEKLFG
jgi:hypothetical protein